RRRHTRSKRDWSSDVCSSDLQAPESFGFVEVLRIRRLAAVDIEAVVAHEFKLLGLEQFGDISDTLIDALQEPFENLSRRAGLSEIGRASCRERGEYVVEGGAC